MLVECLNSNYKCCLEEPKLVEYLGLRSNNELTPLPIEVGAIYLVVGCSLGPFVPWYFVDDRSGLRYPKKYPSNLFKVVDDRHSKLWVTGSCKNRLGDIDVLHAPEQWAYDELFHGRLFEGDAATIKVYEEMLSKLSLEYSLPWIKNKAVALKDGNWVTDDEYSESWEVDVSAEMTVHPVTKDYWHNPLAKSNLVPRK